MTPSASSPNLFNSPSSIATAPPTSGRAILWSLYRVMNLTGFEPPSPEDDGGGGAHLRQIGGVVRGDDRRPLFFDDPRRRLRRPAECPRRRRVRDRRGGSTRLTAVISQVEKLDRLMVDQPRENRSVAADMKKYQIGRNHLSAAFCPKRLACARSSRYPRRCLAVSSVADLSFPGSAGLRTQQLVKTRDGVHLRCCRLLHGSACLPERERAPDRDPFDVAV